MWEGDRKYVFDVLMCVIFFCETAFIMILNFVS